MQKTFPYYDVFLLTDDYHGSAQTPLEDMEHEHLNKSLNPFYKQFVNLLIILKKNN